MSLNLLDENAYYYMYIILPNSDVSTFQAILIISLFFLFSFYLIHLASYRSGFTPNYHMLLSYMIGYNDENNFISFLQNKNQEKQEKETFVPYEHSDPDSDSDSDSNEDNYSFTSYFEKVLSFFIISDNKVRIRL
jgi:hypothetical protein